METAEPEAVNVAYSERKIHLSGVSANPDGPSSHLIRISGVLLYQYTLISYLTFM